MRVGREGNVPIPVTDQSTGSGLGPCGPRCPPDQQMCPPNGPGRLEDLGKRNYGIRWGGGRGVTTLVQSDILSWKLF